MIESEYILDIGVIVAWYTVSGPSNNYLEPSVLGNYLKIPRRYIWQATITPKCSVYSLNFI